MGRILSMLFCGLLFQAMEAQEISEVKVLDFEAFSTYLDRDSDTTFVINFWATWCAPCVKELPLFDQLSSLEIERPLKVILVSLDFKSQLESKLLPFLKTHNVKSEVVFLDAPDANAWIDRVDPSWSGALPGTLIYRLENRKFYERSFENYADLASIVQSFYKI